MACASAGPAGPSRPPHEAAGLGAGVLAVLQHLHAVDEHVAHSGGQLLRLFEGRVVLDLRGVEDDDVGIIAGLKRSTLLDPEVRRNFGIGTLGGKPRLRRGVTPSAV